MTRRRYRPSISTGEARDKVKQVFKTLRRSGFVARMNFLCCSSCAGYVLGERLDASTDKEYAAYWHRQDEERYHETGYLYIRYFFGGHGDVLDADEQKAKDIEAGNKIAAVLTVYEVAYRWNGDPTRAIEVFDSQELLDGVETREKKWKEQQSD